MKVWFGCTSTSWSDYRDYYFLIRNELIKLDCVVLHDWIDYADEVAKGKRNNTRNPKVYEQVTQAIVEADIVVIENTVPNFSTAHQINFSLLRRKPTLVLRLHKDKTLFSDSYIESIKDRNLQVREYDEGRIGEILKKFVRLNSFDQSQSRYNIVLERRQNYYLDWLSQVEGKSRSALLRELLEERMQQDARFERYLDAL